MITSQILGESANAQTFDICSGQTYTQPERVPSLNAGGLKQGKKPMARVRWIEGKTMLGIDDNVRRHKRKTQETLKAQTSQP
jgi:hypothetical protein